MKVFFKQLLLTHQTQNKTDCSPIMGFFPEWHGNCLLDLYCSLCPAATKKSKAPTVVQMQQGGLLSNIKEKTAPTVVQMQQGGILSDSHDSRAPTVVHMQQGGMLSDS